MKKNQHDEIEYECVRCGTTVKENDKVCPNCGDSVEEEVISKNQPSPASSQEVSTEAKAQTTEEIKKSKIDSLTMLGGLAGLIMSIYIAGQFPNFGMVGNGIVGFLFAPVGVFIGVFIVGLFNKKR